MKVGDYVRASEFSKVYRVKAVFDTEVLLTIAPKHPDGARYDRNFLAPKDKVIPV
jgi:hypothetical protein